MVKFCVGRDLKNVVEFFFCRLFGPVAASSSPELIEHDTSHVHLEVSFNPRSLGTSEGRRPLVPNSIT